MSGLKEVKRERKEKNGKIFSVLILMLVGLLLMAACAPSKPVEVPPLRWVSEAQTGSTGYVTGIGITRLYEKYTGNEVVLQPAKNTAAWMPLMKNREADAAAGLENFEELGPTPLRHVGTVKYNSVRLPDLDLEKMVKTNPNKELLF